MTFRCEWWNPQDGKARSCDLPPGEECPYHYVGGCYEDDE